MISSARVQRLVREYEQYEAITNNFKTTFGTLPGDVSSGFTVPGNADGVVSGTNSSGYEACYFWAHLKAAGFIQTAITPQSGALCRNGLDTPVSAYSTTAYWHFDYSKTAGLQYFTGSSAGAHYFVLGNGIYNEGCWANPATQISCTNIGRINPLNALAVDKKIDDGLPTSGNVIATNSGSDGLQSSPWAGTSRYCLYLSGGNWSYYTGYKEDAGGCKMAFKSTAAN